MISNGDYPFNLPIYTELLRRTDSCSAHLNVGDLMVPCKRQRMMMIENVIVEQME